MSSLIAPADELSSQLVSDPLYVLLVLLVFSLWLSSSSVLHLKAPRLRLGFCASAAVGRRPEPRPLLDCHEVADGEQLDEVWPGGSGLSGLVSWTVSAAVHRQAGHRESQLLLYLFESISLSLI